MSVSPPSDDPSRAETYHRGRERRSGLAAGLAVGVTLAYCFVRWKPFRVEVAGDSMSPTLEEGDWALAIAPGRLRRGTVVVVEHPRRAGFEMVKRITGVPGDLAPSGRILGSNEYWVAGDHPSTSTDSRHFGAVPIDRMKARVRAVYWPVARRGIVR
jgi:signal peptidase I